MIEVFVIPMIVFGVALLGMAVGVLAGRRQLSGGCSGARGAIGDPSTCDCCGGGRRCSGRPERSTKGQASC